MQDKLPIEGNWPYEHRPAGWQRMEMRRRTDRADLIASEGPGGAVIARLRARARNARQSSQVFLVALVVTVLAGLTYYLFLPFWETFVDTRRGTLLATQAEIVAENRSLDDVRNRIVDTEGSGSNSTLLGVARSLEGLPGSSGPEAVRQAEALVAALRSIPGEAGDSLVRAFIEAQIPSSGIGLRPLAAGAMLYARFRSNITAVQERRAALAILAERTNQRLQELDSFTFAQWRRERLRLGLETFLSVCRESSPDNPTLTQACLAAWQQQQGEAQAWWKTLADQVPPGILILFLLATLSSLYRYNLRLAGFHDSRADALELLAQGRDAAQLRDILAATPGEAVNLASVFLAADKVDMGNIKAKLGQAEVELAKSIGER